MINNLLFKPVFIDNELFMDLSPIFSFLIYLFKSIIINNKLFLKLSGLQIFLD
jgi:hypothetical protein